MKLDQLFGAKKRMTWLTLFLVAAAALRISDWMSTKESTVETVQASRATPRFPKSDEQTSRPVVSLDQVFRPSVQAEVGKDLFAAAPVPLAGAAASGPRKPTQGRPQRIVKVTPAPVTQALSPPVMTPPAPVTHVFPFTVLGRFEMDGSSWLLLATGSQVRSVKIGQNLDGGWKLVQLAANQATVVHLASGEKRVLALSSGK